MRRPHPWILVALGLGLALGACAPTGPATMAPTTTVPPPTTAPTPGAGGQVGATATPTGAPTVEQGVAPSKYANVYVYTVEEQANEGRSLLHVAYPVTEHPTINARLQALSETFIDEFRTQSALQETAYQDYVRETGEEAASFVTQYVQHFDVTIADASLISLAIEQYRFTGGTGSIQIAGHVFDRASGAELAPADLFVSDAYLERLSQAARQELETRVRAEAADAAFDTAAARQEWLESMLGMMQSGTEPRAEAYDGLLFYDDGTLQVQFDKYQVAPGAYGVVTVSLPVDSVVDLLTPKMRELLGYAAQTPVAPQPSSTPEPSPTPESSPTPTAPPTSGGGAPGEVDCAQVPCVALTFDDGPSVYTEGLLDLLRAFGARATFFVLGKSARVQSQTIARMAQEGHEIGNHSWSHLNLVQLTADELHGQIDPTNALVAEITGAAPRYVRPPYGAYDDVVVATAQMPLILWSLDPLDWKDRDADLVAERISEASAGAIILAHDIHASTVEAIPAVLESLAARGIRFVTVSELLAPAQAVAGQVYTRRTATQ